MSTDAPAFAPGKEWESYREVFRAEKKNSGDPGLPEKAEREAADLKFESPVPAETVYLIMSKNFPPSAISWVRRAKWVGPAYVSWSDIDTENKKSWAAEHQPEKVREFQKQIKAHDGHVAPSILVRQKTGKSFIVDGHHRALAREELGQDVLAYIGNVNPEDYMAATETHSQQIHSGSDPENRLLNPCILLAQLKRTVIMPSRGQLSSGGTREALGIRPAM